MAPALLTAVDSTSHVHLIIGSNPLAGARCTRSLEVGAIPKIIAREQSHVHYGLLKRVQDGQVEWLKRDFQDDDLTNLGREEVDHVVDAVFVTLGSQHPLSHHISALCKRLRIAVNVADAPSLCSFTLLSTHQDGPLQIGITTSGRGCKLASRVKREVASSLPPGFGSAVERLGELRRRIQVEDDARLSQLLQVEDVDEVDDDSGQSANFNRLIDTSHAEAARQRRMRWLSQICEYWPLKKLAAITDEDADTILSSYRVHAVLDSEPTVSALIDQRCKNRKGTMVLAGSGPGSPDLLTRATLAAIQNADMILADKLVPSAVLDLIPRRTALHIARKFPGNADAAQDELLELGLQGLKSGRLVLRLKQGDPFLFGRGGEEVHWFRARGFEAIVLPGITSALSGPLFAGIPVTQRDISDEVLICTGTGKKGKSPDPPEFKRSRTVVFLMALHRLPSLVESLTAGVSSAGPSESSGAAESREETDGNPLSPRSLQNSWPIATPCAIVERASCRDQRVIRSTLEYICAAVEELGSQPPGLLVAGEACQALQGLESREKWRVEHGLPGVGDLDWLNVAAVGARTGYAEQRDATAIATPDVR